MFFAPSEFLKTTRYTFKCTYLIIKFVPDFHESLNKVPIFVKTCALYKTLYGYLQSFPRYDRYSFGQKCEAVLLEILETIIMASSLSKQEKLPILKKASAKVDILRVLFTLGHDLKIIDNKKYQVLDSLLREIGRMIGGWIKAANQI